MVDSNQLLEDLVDHFCRLSMPEYPHADLRNDVKTSAPGKQARPNGLLRRPLINRRSQLIIVAAGLAVACGLLWMWRPNSNSETLVFGQVKEAIQAIRSVSYTVTTTGWENDPWPDPYITNVMALEPGRVRVERDRELQIINPQENRFILIRHKERKVAIYPLYPRSDVAELPLDDFTQQLRNIPSIAVRKTGVRDVNGRKVVQFLWDNDDDYLIDVDAATMLPVRMEVIRGKASNNSEIREVISNFIFDAEVDESLFRATIPDGYIVEKRDPDKSRNTYPKHDARTLVLSPGRLEPVASGMSKQEIISHLGKPDWIGTKTFGGYLQIQAPIQRAPWKSTR